MEPFPVDIDPKQIVHWVMAERRIFPSSLKTQARRATEVRQIPARADLHLGDEEREDLSEIATVATLEISPGHPSDGWRMTVTVEDEIGPRGPGRGGTVEADGQIDLDTFNSLFIRRERGIATVVAARLLFDPPPRGDVLAWLIGSGIGGGVLLSGAYVVLARRKPEVAAVGLLLIYSVSFVLSALTLVMSLVYLLFK